MSAVKNTIIPLLYVIFLCLIGLSWLDSRDTGQALRISALEQNRLVAKLVKDNLLANIRSSQNLLQLISKNPEVHALLLNPPPSPLLHPGFLTSTDMEEYSFIKNISLFNTDKQLLASSQSPRVFPEILPFLDAALAGQASRSGPFWDVEGKPVYVFSFPVRIEGILRGALTAVINLNALAAEWHQILQYSSVERVVIADKHIFMDSQGPVQLDQPFPGYLRNHFSRISNTDEGIVRLKDLEQQSQMLTWYSSIPKTEWKIIVLTSNNTVYAPAQALLNRSLWINALGAGLAAFLVWVLLRLQRMALRRAVDLSLSEVGEELAALPRHGAADDISTIYQSLTIAFGKLKEKAVQAERMHHELEKQIQEVEKSNRLASKAHEEILNYKNHLEQMVEERTKSLHTAQSRLAYEQSLLRTMFDTIPDLIFFKDTQGRYATVNKAFEKFFGLPLAQIQGLRDSDIFGTSPEFCARCMATDQEALAQNTVLCLEEMGAYPGGIMLVHEVSKIACYTESGECIGVLGVARDVSQRKEAEEALMQATAKAVEASQAKSDFLARMSHEIRTPMNGILGLAYIAMQADPEEKQMQFLHKIHHSALNLLNIINDILDFSKIEAGKMEVEKISFSLEKMLGSLMDTCALEAWQKKLDFSYVLEEGVPLVLCADSLRVHQVLLNLISNALKFTEKGSVKLSVNIVAEADCPPQVDFFQTRLKQEYLLRFRIEDSGIGMTPGQVEQLFQSFSQADDSITRRFGGTGLGLVISKRLAELMHGDILVQSVFGQGSVFDFYVPVSSARQTEIPSRPHRTFADLRGKHVLLVEDNSINQEIAGALLEQFGITYDVAENGQEAVAKAQQGHYALILMDIQMPVMDGLSATRLLRADARPALREIPIVAITANAMSGDKEKSLAAGMNDHISKPFDPLDFRAVLEHWLCGGPPSDSLPAPKN